jgi:trans-aconitate 2-methyltransferase
VAEPERTTDWDAETYHRIAGMQERWGLKVLDRLPLRGDETVLDAGCGSGRMTRHILERVPNGRVIGVDASPSMIEHARQELGESDRLELVTADLLELELDEPVDAIFSNATLHWVLDHERLFQRLFAALRPGGRMEAQFGGEGNVAEWEAAIIALEADERFAPHLGGRGRPWYFAGLQDTEARLRGAGFEIERLSLDEFDEQPPDPHAFMKASGLNTHLQRLPEELRDEFVDALRDSLPSPVTLHYVRLNVSARRPAGG